MIIITKVLGKISLICWSGVFFMVLNAYFQHTLTRLAPILAYNHIQGFFGWTFFYCFR